MNPTAFPFLILVLSTGRLSAQGSFFEGKTPQPKMDAGLRRHDETHQTSPPVRMAKRHAQSSAHSTPLSIHSPVASDGLRPAIA